MNIVVASDENYILPTKVMLTSFLLNNRQEYHNIYFLYSAVKKESVDALIGLVGKYDAQLIPVMISESDFEGFACLGPYTIETYYRLVIPHILPDTEERALWMDVDIVVDGALDEFYYQELGEYAWLARIVDELQFADGCQQFDAFQVADSVEVVMSAVGLHLLVTDGSVTVAVESLCHLGTEVLVGKVRAVYHHVALCARQREGHPC